MLSLSSGFAILSSDWLVNRGGRLFHAVVAIVTAGLALAGWSVVRVVSRPGCPPDGPSRG